MSTKGEKPTLAGVTIKTRKRNIAVALDPGSFADAVITIFEDSSESDSLEQNLQAAVKVLENTQLDFSRYGDTLFEVLFAGGRMASGGTLAPEANKLDTNVLASAPNREAILPYVKVFQTLLRRRPFLIRPLENTLIKLLKTLDFYDDAGREKLAIATARCLAGKLGAQPDRVLLALMNDRMVAKGTILQWATAFFQDFLATEPMDELVVVLRKARIDARLLELFPPQKRTVEDFDAHFKAANLPALVDYNNKKVGEVHVTELTQQLTTAVESDPPLPVEEVLSATQARKQEWNLSDVDIIKVLWTVLVDAVPTGGKNGQQIVSAIGKQVKTYSQLLTAFSSTGRAEAALISHVQVYCYEDSKLLKLFSDILRILYNSEVISEDTIMWWYKKGSSPKGRSVFLRDVEPFIKWLEEAEEEEDDNDE